MPKPTTVKLVGMFELPDTVSLKELQQTVERVDAILQGQLGPGQLVLKIGRQELRA